jgi:hypothetical protein
MICRAQSNDLTLLAQAQFKLGGFLAQSYATAWCNCNRVVEHAGHLESMKKRFQLCA